MSLPAALARSRALGLALGCCAAMTAAACGEQPPAKSGIHDEAPLDTRSVKALKLADQPDDPRSEDPAPPAAAAADAGTPDPALPAGKAAAGKPGAGAPAGKTAGGSVQTINGRPRMNRPPKTGPLLTAGDCERLTDKYVDLVIAGDGAPLAGQTGKQLEQAREMVKAAAANDPNLVNMKKQCVKEVRKSQFDCAMRARTHDEWEDCVAP